PAFSALFSHYMSPELSEQLSFILSFSLVTGLFILFADLTPKRTDRKKRLEDHLPRLQTVLFQQQLGTLRDKTDRIQALAGWIAG
ncbi:glycine--tRNA ligase subunit beta, partial [Salmonella enterica subsp. enterica serovar Cerro]|nr:glycine--tRNA ligase subunit beta [Salmonella enterica subsp. enterica serovar Cerro]